MGSTVSDFVLARLRAWGIKRIYGYPGDGINGLMGAFGRVSEGLEFLQVRHEEMAAFMACAHAKFTGEVGCCMATSGPGAIHLLNGLYDAKMDHMPVVAIVGQASTMAIGGEYQQEVNLEAAFGDVCSQFVVTVANPGAARHAIDRAVRIAIGTRSPTCVIFPKDVQEMNAVEKEPHAHNTVHSSVGLAKPRILPHDEDLRRAAEILNAGSRVAMLVGAGATNAEREVIEVAERLGAGVAKALLGKAVLSDELPFVTGTIGLLGTLASTNMMQSCDTLLMVGTSFPYSEFLPKEGQVRGIQIDLDPRYLGIRYPTELNLVGDAAETLRALAPLLERKTDRSWREKIEADNKHEREIVEARARVDAKPINPERVFFELSPLLPDRCIITGDAGTATNWLARVLRMRSGMKFSLSGGLATMGPAVPYAIAAKFAFPERVALALTGDGAMQMNGNAELLTIAKYWRRWRDPRLVVLVLNNRDLNQVTWEMRIESGNPKFEASQDLPDFPYAAYASSIGLRGIRVDEPQQIATAWKEALSSDRPVVLEAVVDANVSIIPPHIQFEQAHAFAQALLKGDPDERGVIAETAKQLLAGILPPRGNGEGR